MLVSKGGIILQRIGKYNKAIESFEEIVRLNEDGINAQAE